MKPATPDLILRSRCIVTPGGLCDAAILMGDGTILDVVAPDNLPGGVPVDDVGDRVVLPGLVDSHVHINEPGRTAWEGFEIATKAAAAGGITTLVDMPLNSTPVTTTVAALEQKRAAASGQCWVDCGFYGGVVPGNAHHVQPLLHAGVLGMKAFLCPSGIDDFPNATEADLHAVMPIIARSGRSLLVHAELIDESAPTPGDPKSYTAYLRSRPPSWELHAIDLMIRLCRTYSCPVHIVHLSATEAIPMLRAAREEGLPLTVETCPHYLFFAAEEIPDADTRFKCAPPIRGKDNRERLWDALHDGVIDFIASDHSPCLPELKCLEDGDFQRAWGGIASLQLGLPVMWTAMRERGFSVQDLGRWMATEPAKRIGLAGYKGAIAPGYDADLVVWNPDATFTVTPNQLQHRHKVTPYEGCTLHGVVEQTWLRGQRIYDRGHVASNPVGRLVRTRA